MSSKRRPPDDLRFDFLVISNEPTLSQWKRRARTVPMMLAVTVIGVLTSPAIVLCAALVDLAKRRYRLPTVRVAVFLLQYVINDSVEILCSPIYWVMAGFGTRLSSASSIARHQRLQQWSIEVLARRAERLLGVRLEIDSSARSAFTPGPVIVLCRHVNLVDASLPALIYQRLGFRTVGVIMAELLADPGFDLIYARTGSVFIARDNGPEAVTAIRALGERVDTNTAVAIFPEGRLFRADALDRAKGRLAEQSPERAARLAGLRHVLPPRPGGVLALLDTVQADVVVIAHVGLDSYPSFSELAKAVPLASPIRVHAWRIDIDQIPADRAQRIEWLDEQWIRVDQWVHEHRDVDNL